MASPAFEFDLDAARSADAGGAFEFDLDAARAQERMAKAPTLEQVTAPPTMLESAGDWIRAGAGAVGDAAVAVRDMMPAPVRGTLGAVTTLPVTVGAQLTEGGRKLHRQAWDKAVAAEEQRLGRALSTMEALALLPGAGTLGREAFDPERESSLGGVAELVGNIATDPTIAATGGARAGVTALGSAVARQAPQAGRLATAAQGAANVLGSAPVAAVYAPDIAEGVARGVENADPLAAMGMGALGGLMGKGIVDEARQLVRRPARAPEANVDAPAATPEPASVPRPEPEPAPPVERAAEPAADPVAAAERFARYDPETAPPQVFRLAESSLADVTDQLAQPNLTPEQAAALTRAKGIYEGFLSREKDWTPDEIETDMDRPAPPEPEEAAPVRQPEPEPTPEVQFTDLSGANDPSIQFRNVEPGQAEPVSNPYKLPAEAPREAEVPRVEQVAEEARIEAAVPPRPERFRGKDGETYDVRPSRVDPTKLQVSKVRRGKLSEVSHLTPEQVEALRAPAPAAAPATPPRPVVNDQPIVPLDYNGAVALRKWHEPKLERAGGITTREGIAELEAIRDDIKARLDATTKKRVRGATNKSSHAATVKLLADELDRYKSAITQAKARTTKAEVAAGVRPPTAPRVTKAEKWWAEAEATPPEKRTTLQRRMLGDVEASKPDDPVDGHLVDQVPLLMRDGKPKKNAVQTGPTGFEGVQDKSAKEVAAAIAEDENNPTYLRVRKSFADMMEELGTDPTDVSKHPAALRREAERVPDPDEWEDAGDARYSVRKPEGQRGMFGSEDDVPVAAPKKKAPQQTSMFRVPELLASSEKKVTEGREADGPLFTQEADARDRAAQRSQGDLFGGGQKAAEPTNAEIRAWYDADLPSRDGLRSMPIEQTIKRYVAWAKANGVTPDVQAFGQRLVKMWRDDHSISLAVHDSPAKIPTDVLAMLPKREDGRPYYYWTPLEGRFDLKEGVTREAFDEADEIRRLDAVLNEHSVRRRQFRETAQEELGAYRPRVENNGDVVATLRNAAGESEEIRVRQVSADEIEVDLRAVAKGRGDASARALQDGAARVRGVTTRTSTGELARVARLADGAAERGTIRHELYHATKAVAQRLGLWDAKWDADLDAAFGRDAQERAAGGADYLRAREEFEADAYAAWNGGRDSTLGRAWEAIQHAARWLYYAATGDSAGMGRLRVERGAFKAVRKGLSTPDVARVEGVVGPRYKVEEPAPVKSPGPKSELRKGIEAIASPFTSRRFIRESLEMVRGYQPQLAALLERYDHVREVRASRDIKTFMEALNKLGPDLKTRSEVFAREVVPLLENRGIPENVSPVAREVAADLRGVYDAVKERAKKYGVLVGERENYFTWMSLDDDPRSFDAMVKRYEQALQIPHEEAVAAVNAARDAQKKRQTGGRMMGHLEISRGEDPFTALRKKLMQEKGLSEWQAYQILPRHYRTDPDVVVQYLLEANRRISEAAFLGKRHERANKYLDKIEDQRAREAVRDVLKGMTGTAEEKLGQREISSALRKGVAYLKLGVAAPLQLTSIVPTAMGVSSAGMGRAVQVTAQEVWKHLTGGEGLDGLKEFQKHREAAKLDVMDSGAIFTALVDETADAWGTRGVSKWAPHLKAIGEIDKDQRVIAARVIRTALPELVQKARGGDKRVVRDLERLLFPWAENDGTNPKDPHVLKAMKLFADQTQGRTGVAHLPVTWSSPAGKVLVQFLNFPYRMTKGVLVPAVKDAIGGDYRKLTMLVALGAAVGEIPADLRAAIQGKSVVGNEEIDTEDFEWDSPLTWASLVKQVFSKAARSERIRPNSPIGALARGLQNLATVGGFGLVDAIIGRITRATTPSGVAGALLGPAGGIGADLTMEPVIKAANGDIPGAAREFMRGAVQQIPFGLGSQIQSEIESSGVGEALGFDRKDRPASPGWIGRARDLVDDYEPTEMTREQVREGELLRERAARVRQRVPKGLPKKTPQERLAQMRGQPAREKRKNVAREIAALKREGRNSEALALYNYARAQGLGLNETYVKRIEAEEQ